jgi:hypothetical protein
MINDMSNEYELIKSSINLGTVKSSIIYLNRTGFAPQRISPFIEIEPLIVQWIVLLAEMGHPLTKFGIIELVNDVIENTCYSHQLSEFKQKRQILTNKELRE